VKVALWIALLVPNLAAELAAWMAAPFLGLLVDDRGRLPRWLRMFETPDNTAFGDRDHARRWANRSLYPRFVAWFWRNPAYTFSNDVLGARASGPVRVSGNLWVSDRPLVEGWCLRQTDEGYWHVYVVRCWALGFCLRLNMGWKLAGEPGGPNFGQYVCSVNPFLIRSSGMRSSAHTRMAVFSHSGRMLGSPCEDPDDQVSRKGDGQ
jgi:hypothetical protein